MSKNFFFVIPLLILVFLIYRFFVYHPSTKQNTFQIKGQEYNLEIATTLTQKEQGLMNRTNLCQNCGMIFVSTIEIPQIFWMKNTLIPLDIIFLDKKGRVINIASALPQPGVPDEQLTLYKSDRNSKYVIELNAGDSDKLNLKTGDYIDLSTL